MTLGSRNIGSLAHECINATTFSRENWTDFSRTTFGYYQNIQLKLLLELLHYLFYNLSIRPNDHLLKSFRAVGARPTFEISFEGLFLLA